MQAWLDQQRERITSDSREDPEVSGMIGEWNPEPSIAEPEKPVIKCPCWWCDCTVCFLNFKTEGYN